jgi:hypothetical protein
MSFLKLVADAFHEGGSVMWLILLLTPVTLVMAIVHAIVARRWSLAPGGGAIVLVLAVGGIATVVARNEVEAALRGVDPELYGILRDRGNAEAARPLQFSAWVAGFAAVPLAVGITRLATRSQSFIA